MSDRSSFVAELTETVPIDPIEVAAQTVFAWFLVEHKGTIEHICRSFPLPLLKHDEVGRRLINTSKLMGNLHVSKGNLKNLQALVLKLDSACTLNLQPAELTAKTAARIIELIGQYTVEYHRSMEA